MQATMQEAFALTDANESIMDRAMHGLYAALAYLMPLVVAVAAGWWIGDGFSGPFRWNGDSAGVHLISYAGEITLSMTALALSRSVKRMTNDKAVWKYLLVVSIAFAVFALASALAQWVLIMLNIGTIGLTSVSPAAIAIVIMFRCVMPIAVDVGSLLYLGVHGYRSLKRKLAQMDERGEAFEKLIDRKLAITAKEEKARQDSEDREAERAQRQRTNDLLNRITEMQNEAAIAQIEKSLNPNVVDGSRQFRRTSNL